MTCHPNRTHRGRDLPQSQGLLIRRIGRSISASVRVALACPCRPPPTRTQGSGFAKNGRLEGSPESVRHGSAKVLARVARSDDVDARDYTFRAWTQVETAAAEHDWLNEGLLIGVGGRQGEESPTTPTPSVAT
jgi:hypothetical protein